MLTETFDSSFIFVKSWCNKETYALRLLITYGSMWEKKIWGKVFNLKWIRLSISTLPLQFN